MAPDPAPQPRSAPGPLRYPVRVAARLTTFLAVNLTGILHHRWHLARRGLGLQPAACARWLQTWSRHTLSRIGIPCRHEGTVPGHGLIVCNHLGYLDIPVLATTGPMVFVSKADVEAWPFLGTLARCGGTLFLKREQRSHVAQIADALRPIVDSGTVVTIFPEGTSSGGDAVLPFRSSLLEPAAANRWPVTPACVWYELDDGTVAEHVAYWRDMVFATHFLQLLARRQIRACVRYGQPVSGVGDRKELSRILHARVTELHRLARPGSATRRLAAA